MVRELEVINKETRRGTTITELDFLKIARVCKTRNNEMYIKFKSDYEHLFNEKYPEK